jgi:stress-induced morphogen
MSDKFEEALDAESPQDSWAEAIRDMQARNIAMVELLISHGGCTEQEFQQRRTHWARRLDEERTRRLEEREQAADLLRGAIVKQLYAHLTSFPEFVVVDLFRSASPDMLGVFDMILIRVISPSFHNKDYLERQRLVRSRVLLAPVSVPIEANKILVVALTPEEKPGSLASLQFDMMIEAQGLAARD